MRINKYLAERGVASRRTVDEMIARGRVVVNGTMLEKPGYLVGEHDIITVDGKKIEQGTGKAVVILLNKPADCITTNKDTHGRKTVLDYVKVRERVFPIGRLDKNTTGVLLLTNDGNLANRLMHPRHEVEKVYHAHLDRPFTAFDKQRFERGIMLEEGKTASCVVRYFKNDRRNVMITLHEGRNRQIHRMFQALGYQVEELERMSYAGLTVTSLKLGAWRFLTEKEIEYIKQI